MATVRRTRPDDIDLYDIHPTRKTVAFSFMSEDLYEYRVFKKLQSSPWEINGLCSRYPRRHGIGVVLVDLRTVASRMNSPWNTAE